MHAYLPIYMFWVVVSMLLTSILYMLIRLRILLLLLLGIRIGC